MNNHYEVNAVKIRNVTKMVSVLVENSLIEQDIMMQFFTSNEIV